MAPMDFRSFEDAPEPPAAPVPPALPGGDDDRHKAARLLTATAWELKLEAGRMRTLDHPGGAAHTAAQWLSFLGGLASVGAKLALREDLADIWPSEQEVT